MKTSSNRQIKMNPKDKELSTWLYLEALNHPNLNMIGAGTKVTVNIKEITRKCRCEMCGL